MGPERTVKKVILILKGKHAFSTGVVAFERCGHTGVHGIMKDKVATLKSRD